MYTIRFIRLLRFNRKISVLGDTLMHVAKPIVSFMIVFLTAFLAFAMTAFVFFGRNLRTFRNFVTTLETLISMMLNKFDYESLMAETKIIGPLMFGLFCLMFNIILINFFITVILEGFTALRYDEQKQSNEYEILDFMLRRVKMTLGVGELKRKKRSSTQGFTSDPKKMQHVYIEKLTPEEEKIAELDSSKVNTMIGKLEGLTDVKQEQEELKDELELFKRKKRIIVA